MEEIERAMSQFGGAFDGSAGPIRSVTSRTCDVLPMIGRVAELLHAGLALEQRIAKLVLRLDLGIQGPIVDLARYAERSLDRSDYRRLCDARMTDRDALEAADDNALLPLIGNDRRKLASIARRCGSLATGTPRGRGCCVASLSGINPKPRCNRSNA